MHLDPSATQRRLLQRLLRLRAHVPAACTGGSACAAAPLSLAKNQKRSCEGAKASSHRASKKKAARRCCWCIKDRGSAGTRAHVPFLPQRSSCARGLLPQLAAAALLRVMPHAHHRSRCQHDTAGCRPAARLTRTHSMR
jgi:hypothetical protein